MREAIFINLREAYFCEDCKAVGNSANRCARCLSDALLPVSRVMQRQEAIHTGYPVPSAQQ
jgi:hypothetical protein